MVIFDLETTGLDLVNDRIIQISYIKVFPDGKETRANHYINPDRPISPESVALTGITDEQVKDAPTFKQLAASLGKEFEGCDFAGYNSNHFDIPMLAEEFLRSGIDFDFAKSRLVDVQTIFHKMEQRTLAAAYKFYCGRDMEKDFDAHKADQDTEATYRVLQGELDMYSAERQEEPSRRLENDIEVLANFSKINQNIDFAGRIVWKEKRNAAGDVMTDSNGMVQKEECFNFGKYRGQSVREVLQKDPGYFSWMLNGDFTYNTKQVLTRIKLQSLTQK